MTRNAGRKRRVRERAAREGIRYREASRLDRAQTPDDSSTFRALAEREMAERRSVPELVADYLDSWCADRTYEPVEDLSSDLVDDFGWHPALEQVTVAELTVEPLTVDAQVEEEFDGGTLALVGFARASLQVEGYMPRAEVFSAADAGRVVILDADVNDHYAEVAVPDDGMVELEFSALVDLEGQTVETFELTGVRFLGPA